MAVPTFSEYTYKISYKATSSSAEIILSEELRIIEAKTNIIDDNGASVEAPNPNYNYFMTTLVCKVTPQKNTTIIIKRNAVRDGESAISHGCGCIQDHAIRCSASTDCQRLVLLPAGVPRPL